MAQGHLSRCLLRAVAAGALATTVLTLAGPVTAGASTLPGAHAADPRIATASTVSLLGIANAKTANGVGWYLLVSDSPGSTNSTDNLDVALERLATGTDFEFHNWTFTVNSSTFSFNDKSGTLDVGSEASPVVPTLDLSFKTTSSKPAACESGSETAYTGTLSGSVKLVTGLSGGGTVTGSLSFDVTPPTVLVDQGCVPPPSNTCGSVLLAGTLEPGSSAVSVFAENFKLPTVTLNSVGLARSTQLSAPKGAMRIDAGADIDKAGKVYAKYAKGKVEMKSSGGIVTGSAMISGGTKHTFKDTCSYKSTKYSETIHVADGATYSGAFTATMAIGPDLTAPKSTKTGFYEVVTSKAT